MDGNCPFLQFLFLAFHGKSLYYWVNFKSMQSPFPGMDPYLEGYMWPDVHHELASEIRADLAQQISPRYVARISTYTVEDTSPEEEVGIMCPDVEVLKKPAQVKEEETVMASTSKSKALTPATVSIPGPKPVEVRIPLVEIRDRAQNQLITAIEILSPVIKRKPGLVPYREKRQRLHRAGVHLLEIDLLRRGQRPIQYIYLPRSPYMVSLARGEEEQISIWAFGLNDKAPVLPVPLKQPDEDARLDLGEALRRIYQRGLYHLSINYREAPPPPALSREEQAWMEELLKVFREAK